MDGKQVFLCAEFFHFFAAALSLSQFATQKKLSWNHNTKGEW